VDKLVARRIIADKYRLERALAAGGMGSVWAAWNTQLDVPVAIKFMAPAMASSHELVARFEREARAAAQIRSSHVVQIYEHGVEDGLPFIVMELLEGEDLGQRMRRVGRMDLADTARIVAAVCKALRRAHAIGIVHRDLKPANIFLACGDEEDDEVVKVLDFGVVKSLAEAVDSGVTKTGELIGTPNYMSPEQARSTKTVDHRSDLWSLGIITYRALTATLPFPDDEGIERLMRICSEPVPPPSLYATDLGPEVDAFFVRALAMDPEDRFQTAREMAEALAAVAGVPVSSRTGSRSHYPSQLDMAPLSNSVYTAHAYVYTSAADAEEGPNAVSPPRGKRRPSGSAIPRPGSGPPPSMSPRALSASRASGPGGAARTSSPSAVPAAPVEQATRVSGIDAPPGLVPPTPRPPRPPRPPVVQVALPSPDITPPSMSPLGVAHEVGTRQSSGRVSSEQGTPRWRIAAGVIVTAAVLGGVGLALVERAARPDAEASPAASGLPSAPAQALAAAAPEPTAVVSAASAAPPASSADPDPAAAPSSAAAAASASAAASSSALASAAAPTPKPSHDVRPPPAPSGPRPAAGKGARPSARTEGGLGRKPTY
jgi:serine/threonine-protein kinase